MSEAPGAAANKALAEKKAQAAELVLLHGRNVDAARAELAIYLEQNRHDGEWSVRSHNANYLAS